MTGPIPPGRVERIWVKRSHRGPMDDRRRARLVAGRGIEGNADQGGRRQVTIISLDRWRDVRAVLGVAVDPVARRANLLVSGIDLEHSLDRVLRAGPSRLRILGETRPCARMDEAASGLRAALDARWGGGAYAEVLDDGELAVGDAVEWIVEPGE
jgi:MOSC domain-containing protein YiiM